MGDLTEARAALALHDHHPSEVCPTCCDDVCDPAVAGLRATLAAYDTLTNNVIAALTLPDGEPVTRDPVKLATYAAEQLSAEVAMVGQLTGECDRLRDEGNILRGVIRRTVREHEQMSEIVCEAGAIIGKHLPEYTDWLRRASIATGADAAGAKS